MIGETIKGFEITARIGKGGMGEVWVAEQPIVKTKVAIKVLHKDMSTDRQLVQRFFNEAIAVSKIRHAGIVKIHDVGFHNAAAFLIMELLEGETLGARIRRVGRLAPGEVGELGRQIASVLEATHTAHVTHRDLKPDNVFLVQDSELASGERVKILDFGVAKLGNKTSVTATGVAMGTPSYMAPEQWGTAMKADSSADVYSLGCIVFEMCCGRPPFLVSSIPDAYTKHLHDVPPRACSLVPEVPPELDNMIARMLAKRPADRPSTKELQRVCAAVGAAHGWARGATQPMAGDTVPLRVRPVPVAVPVAQDTTLGAAVAAARVEPRSRSWRLIAFVAVAIVGIAAAGYAVMQGGHEPSSKPIVNPAPPQGDERKVPSNAWVRVTVPTTPVVLGIERDRVSTADVGFRPGRNITSPATPYELQEHEVTWSEIEPWLAASHSSLGFPPWATDRDARASLPVTGVTWSIALAYCRSLGGSLPTEEQWEYAARGPERRPNSWGADRLDPGLTHVYAGPNATPAGVKTSLQDQTPPPALYDLVGNVQEWTLGLWREDLPGTNEAWVSSGETSIRAIRGLPLGGEPPPSIQVESAAYREQLCATGPCVEKGAELRQYVGFRCAKAAAL
jgi:serine/threonine-protein kinase